MGYSHAGFDVVGVDIAPQPHYPFEFHQGDALAVQMWVDDLGPFDAIHASPPCQAYSSITPNRSIHPDLYGPTLRALRASGLPWVIENVIGAPYESGVVLCGSMFGLQVRRHRNFESSFLIDHPPCDHKNQGQVWGVYGHGGGTTCRRPNGQHRGWKAKPSDFASLMEMPWATPKEIVLAVPPAYTKCVGESLARFLNSN